MTVHALLEDSDGTGLVMERQIAPHETARVANAARIREEQEPRVLDRARSEHVAIGPIGSPRAVGADRFDTDDLVLRAVHEEADDARLRQQETSAGEQRTAKRGDRWSAL